MKAQILERDLISQARTGDLDAFNELVLQHQDGAYRYAASLVDDHDLADDITQESFIKAFKHIRDLNDDSIRSWLFKIITNTARDHARRNARHPTVPLYLEDDVSGEENDSPAWIIDPDQSVENTVQQHETSRQLYCLLDEMPADFRSVIILVDLQEIGYTEAAAILKIPLGTVKSRLARARMQLRKRLQRGKDKCFGSGRVSLSTAGLRYQCP